ncbi:hypothetical protein [Rummeliibacillus pycnus]|uniref:hypothetical protein n=1 Tax=Rummeliibacillus pycnus TaxID=101070 RepID=UPI003D2B2A69
MVTKLKKHSAFIWSLIALIMALCSLLYCLTFIFHTMDFSFAKTFAQLTRAIGGV